jgi:hypothetical protein
MTDLRGMFVLLLILLFCIIFNFIATLGDKEDNLLDIDDKFVIGDNYLLGYPFNGSIDSVRIYNRALSPGEVRDLYNFAPGPVGWWKMDEKVLGNGQTINDSSGYGNTGTTSSANGTGMDCYVQGKYGSACEFDGVDDYVDISTVIGEFNTEIGSVGLYVNFPVLPTDAPERIFSAWVLTSNRIEIILSDTASCLRFRYQAGNILEYIDVPYSELSINMDYHIQMTWNQTSSEFKAYIDGVQTGTTQSIANAFAGTIATVYLGKIGSAAGQSFNGTIDDVRIYNYARTQAQIMEDYSAGAGRKQPIGHWKFDEGYGTTANNSGIGGTTLNGTLTNMSSPATSSSGWTDSGKMGKGLVFDGSNDYVRIEDSSELDIVGNLTLSVWAKRNRTSQALGASEAFLYKKSDNTWWAGPYGFWFDYGAPHTDKIAFIFNTINTGADEQIVRSTSMVILMKTTNPLL